MDDKYSEAYYRRFLDQVRRGSYNLTPSVRQNTTVSKRMNTTRTGIAEIDGMDSSKVKNFPFSSFKLLGAMQIGIGVICLLLGIVDLFLFLYTMTHYDDDTLKALTIACVPVWCGLWFIVAGSMGSCMSLQHKTTLTYFKMTFLVLSVLCCVLFAPVLFVVEVYIVILRNDGSESAYEWLIPMVIAFFTLNEMVCALITASICCCCSPLNQAKVRVLYTRHLDEYNEPRQEKTRLDTPEIFYTESSRYDKMQGHAPVHSGRRENPASDYDHWDEKQEPVSRRQPQQEPRVAMTSSSPAPIQYSRPPTYEKNTAQSYRRMKQLALPGNPDTY